MSNATPTPPTTPNPPDGLHDPVPFGYSHTAVVPAGRDLVLVAGQYASDATGAVTSPDFAAQVRQVFANVGRALAAHDLTLADVVQLRTSVVDHDPQRLGVVGGAVGDASLAIPDILVEVEAIAVRP